MNRYNPNTPSFPQRKIMRLKNYDYSQAGLYFITICCKYREHLFGIIENGEMILNEFGKIAYDTWAETPQIRDNCQLHEFIIMPNHIHGIIEIIFQKASSNEIGKFKSPSETIGSIIRGFKIATIKRIREKIEEIENIKKIRTGELQFAPAEFAPTIIEKIKLLDFKIWQRNYYDNIIRDQRAYNNISNYFINNPAKWADDKFFET